MRKPEIIKNIIMLISFCLKFINLTLFKASFEGVRYIIKQNKYEALPSWSSHCCGWMTEGDRTYSLNTRKSQLHIRELKLYKNWPGSGFVLNRIARVRIFCQDKV